MRHRILVAGFNRTYNQRQALFRSLLRSLLYPRSRHYYRRQS